MVTRRSFLGLMGVVGSLGGLGVAKALSAKDGVFMCSCGSQEFFGSSVQTFRPEKSENITLASGCICAKCGEKYIVPSVLPSGWRNNYRISSLGTSRANAIVDNAARNS